MAAGLGELEAAHLNTAIGYQVVDHQTVVPAHGGDD